MLLVDYNAVAIAAFFAESDGEIHEGLLRHVIYNSLRNINKMFRDDYGVMTICCDNSSWRKEQFDWYKAGRAKGREESDIDWNELYRLIREFSKELSENTHFPRVSIHGAEADDIIAVLTSNCPSNEEVMIVSGDKDFKQLQKWGGVHQYSPKLQKEIKLSPKEALEFLAEQIIRGDGSDGIPNILSPADFFAEREDYAGKRQKSVTKKFLSQNLDNVVRFLHDGSCDLSSTLDEEVFARFEENNTLINLDCIPENIQVSIVNAYNLEIDKLKERKTNIIDFLIRVKCNKLVEVSEDFRANQSNAQKIEDE